MSLFGRALAGAGGAAADIANKYIDEEITMQKMQALEDMRVSTAQRIEQYANSPEVRGRARAEQVLDVDAANDAALRGARTKATDKVLNAAEIENAAARAVAEATARGRTIADLEIEYGNNPRMLSAIRNKARAQHFESASSVAAAELTRMTIEDRKRLSKLYEDLQVIQDDPKMTPEQKMAKARPVLTQLSAIKARNGGTTAADAKYGYEEITDEKTDPATGRTTTVKRYVPRGQGGAAGQEDDPIMKALIENRQKKDPKADGKASPLAERAKSKAELEALQEWADKLEAKKLGVTLEQYRTMKAAEGYRNRHPGAN